MALAMEFQSQYGAKIRIFDDCMPKTPKEEARNRAQVQRAVVRCLEDGIRANGFEETRRRILEGPHAYLAQAGAAD